MDTRSKILTAAADVLRVASRPVVLVSGYFDVLRAEHVRELTAIRDHAGAKTLVVAVAPLPSEWLPLAARAELVAALRVVDYVLIAHPEDLERLIGSLQPAEWIRLEEADERRIRQLMEHVHRRQTS